MKNSGLKLHFIAIGGSAMHNLAIAMHLKGYKVSGSDDEIFEPSRSRLATYGLLPARQGWDESNIADDIDAVILGMHARADNPELMAAQRKGLRIFSYPEYLYEQSKDKTRIVIGGSHGKTTITSMIMHVLKFHHKDFDYMVGAQIEGFDVMVKLSEEAPVMIFEGDEYLTSPIDRRPKFHLYKPHIALLSGIAWDHINVFPTFENYTAQFQTFIHLIMDNGCLIYCCEDAVLAEIAANSRKDINKIPYSIPDHTVKSNRTSLIYKAAEYPLNIFGRHNLLNISGAMMVCREMGIGDDEFYEAIVHFKGAAKRLELLAENGTCRVYKDFAHAPSKLLATTKAVKEQYAEDRLIACLELHTFSSLNKQFLAEYAGCMDYADTAIVYFSPHAIELKKLPPLSEADIRQAFQRNDLRVFSDPEQLSEFVLGLKSDHANLLLMSSGNFDGLDLKKTGEKFIL